MSMSDTIGDMLARIRNGLHADKSVISCPASKLKGRILEVLKREGFIRDFKEDVNDKGLPVINIELKYDEGEPTIQEIKRVSKPGRRIYRKVGELPRVRNGLGIAIVSTPRGVLSDHEARAQNVGGEIVCTVF